MSIYSVDLAKFWHYTVEANDKVEAENKAYELLKQDEGKYAEYDDAVIACLDNHGNWN